MHVIEVTNPKLDHRQFWRGTDINHILIDICQLDDGYDASITIHYQHLNGNNEIKKPYFKGTYRDGSISLTGGAVFLDLAGLEGQRIGTYLMNTVVAWAKKWPTAQINLIALSEHQASSENLVRRNRFYEQFNIKFQYKDENNTSGLSLPMCANELSVVDTWKQNIQEIALDEFINKLLAHSHQNDGKIQVLSNYFKLLYAWEVYCSCHPVKNLFKYYFMNEKVQQLSSIDIGQTVIANIEINYLNEPIPKYINALLNKLIRDKFEIEKYENNISRVSRMYQRFTNYPFYFTFRKLLQIY